MEFKDFSLTEDLSVSADSAPPLAQPEVAPPRERKQQNAPWNPIESDYKMIRELAGLGWPTTRLSEALNISVDQFAGAIVRFPRVKAEYDLGVADGKAYVDQRTGWLPKPGDLALIRKCASRGLGPIEISSKLKVPRVTFLKRMDELIQIRDALEQGEGEFRSKLMEDSQDMLENADPDLKFTGSLLIFKLKAHCGLSDRADNQPILLEGKIEHKHSLSVPKPVAMEDIAEFARIEMERANKLSSEKMKSLAPPELDYIDVEVKE